MTFPIASDFVSKPVVKDAPRERVEAALRDEATSLQHLMCHTPKNPFCETCNRAKMYKYPSRQKGGSTQVEAKKFGDHLTADHLITSDGREIGIDQSRVALVVRDVATDFRYVYPAARKTSHQCVMAFKHFVRTGETVNIFYSDRAPELVIKQRINWNGSMFKVRTTFPKRMPLLRGTSGQLSRARGPTWNKLVCTIHIGHMRPNTTAWRTTSRITQIIIHLGRYVLEKIFPDHICLLVVKSTFGLVRGIDPTSL